MIKFITKLLNVAGFLAAREAALQLKKAERTEKKRNKVVNKLDKVIHDRSEKALAAEILLSKLNKLSD